VKSALLVIDIQNDFVPEGALAVTDGNAVVDVANQFIKNDKSWFDYVVASQDWHPAQHKSFASQHPGAKPGDAVHLGGVSQILWPDHCIQGSSGSQFVQNLRSDCFDKVIQKGTYLDRDSYSAFFDNAASFELTSNQSPGRSGDTGLNDWLQSHDVSNLTVLGLATDYCVLFSVMDALKLGYHVTVITDGCRSVEVKPGDGQRALSKMKNTGARLITSSELIPELQKRKNP